MLPVARVVRVGGVIANGIIVVCVLQRSLRLCSGLAGFCLCKFFLGHQFLVFQSACLHALCLVDDRVEIIICHVARGSTTCRQQLNELCLGCRLRWCLTEMRCTAVINPSVDLLSTVGRYGQ